MRANRGGIPETRQLTNGPGKLAQALALTRLSHNGLDVTDPAGELLVLPNDYPPFEMVTTTRIGITQGVDLPWRYYMAGQPLCVAEVTPPRRAGNDHAPSSSCSLSPNSSSASSWPLPSRPLPIVRAR